MDLAVWRTANRCRPCESHAVGDLEWAFLLERGQTAAEVAVVFDFGPVSDLQLVERLGRLEATGQSIESGCSISVLAVLAVLAGREGQAGKVGLRMTVTGV